MRARDVDKFGGKEVRIELVSGDRLTGAISLSHCVFNPKEEIKWKNAEVTFYISFCCGLSRRQVPIHIPIKAISNIELVRDLT